MFDWVLNTPLMLKELRNYNGKLFLCPLQKYTRTHNHFKRVLLNRAPTSTHSIHLHPAHSTSTQLHPAPPSSFQSPPSSLQHPQQYLNQNIAPNWAISPNLGQKIKSCSFWLKIGTHSILEVLIPNLDLHFWNSDPKIRIWANLAQKFKVLCFLWKLVHLVSQGSWFRIQT